jgi:hypothetical protein
MHLYTVYSLRLLRKYKNPHSSDIAFVEYMPSGKWAPNYGIKNNADILDSTNVRVFT